MTGFIVAAPQIVVPPGGGDGGGEVTQFAKLDVSRFAITLAGGDGSQWDLVNGPVTLLTGVQAFASPDVTHWWKTSPVIDGSRWDGMRTAATVDILPIGVRAQSWSDWRATDSAFFRAIHPRSQVTFTVTAPDGVSRSKQLRFVTGGGLETIDPLVQLFASYALEFTAANPFWAGDPVSLPFSPAAPVPGFPGPSFYVNPGSAGARSSVANDGDEPVWPRYQITGPAATWTVGVGSALVSSTTAVAAGDTITVDMDPANTRVQNAAGANVYTTLTNDTFAPIPAGASVKLNLTVTGASSASQVVVEFTPLYRRPW